MRAPISSPPPGPEDELEQLRVALEDAQAEVAALAAERDELRLRLSGLEAEMRAERTRAGRRELAVEEMRRRFEAAVAQVGNSVEKESVTQEELRVAMEELRTTADELEATNTELTRLNQNLEDEVAARTVELEEAYASLHKEKERLRLIFEGATDTAILTLDAEGRVSAWNTGAERLLGFTEAEVLGNRLEEMWTPEDLERHEREQEMCRALEHGRAEDDRWHRRKDGSRFWASGIMVPLTAGEGGEHLGFLKIMRDRTAARREEE